MSQVALFPTAQTEPPGPERWEMIDAPGALVSIRRGFLAPDVATKLLLHLVHDVPWRQDKIRMFGKEHELPRLQQWFGGPGHVYVWSGIEMRPLPWTSELLEVLELVESTTRRKFNSVLLNLYRDGQDTVGWHADDEPGLGPTPFIASLSVGSERDFVLRKTDDNRIKVTVPLPHGSLLVMGGETQSHWQHAVPRRKGVTAPRVNLTFRQFQ